MKVTIAVLLSAMLIASVSTPLLAKGNTVKITISGADLKRPIEISDPKILANFCGQAQGQVRPTIRDSLSIGLKVQSEKRPTRFAGIKSRFTLVLPQMSGSCTWSITRSVSAMSRVMYICRANPMYQIYY
jgi:hypothetical protein